jgi:hypothetical protein
MSLLAILTVIFFLSAVGIVGALILNEPAQVHALVEPEVEEWPLAA